MIKLHSLTHGMAGFCKASLLGLLFVAALSLGHCSGNGGGGGGSSGPPPDPSCSDAPQASGFNGGDGSESAPFLICTYEQLGKMRDELSKHYALGANITATASENWMPVGNKDNPFHGSLDGKGYEISRITVAISSNAADQYGGLFGYSSAALRNIGLTGLDISVTTSNGYVSYGGGLAGWNTGTISNSYAKGAVVFRLQRQYFRLLPRFL